MIFGASRRDYTATDAQTSASHSYRDIQDSSAGGPNLPAARVRSDIQLSADVGTKTFKTTEQLRSYQTQTYASHAIFDIHDLHAGVPNFPAATS